LIGVATSKDQLPQAIRCTARIGYAARGLVYLLAGVFSLLAGTGAGGGSVGPRGALSRIIGWPFGETLVYAIAAGLVCFAGWRAIQAIYDPDRFSCGPSSVLRRVFVYGGSAIIHLALAAMAINLALVARATDEDRQARDWTAWILSQPFGRLLAMMLGVGIAIGGVALGAKAIAGDFRSKLPQREPETRWIVVLGRVGFAARGFVFVLVGAFLSMAAWDYDPQQAVGVAGALRSLQDKPYGTLLLGLAAIGLACFGLFELAQAARRRLAGLGRIAPSARGAAS
jgi:Domain of Unknown Function (DUF1206)